MKCRAKMIDQSPVTFSLIAITPFETPVAFTAFEGEGFSAGTELYSLKDVDHRATMEERALRENGVDTATVEYFQDDGMASRAPGYWLPLFPPVVTKPPSTQAMKPGITYVSDFECPTEVDTHEQKLRKAIKWVKGQLAMFKVMPELKRGDWALGILSEFCEDALRPLPAVPEPSYKKGALWLTEKMIDAGCEAWLVSPNAATKRDVVAAIWRAMQWAR